MDKFISTIIEQFGIIGAIIICVVFIGWYIVVKQSKLFKNMGNDISETLVNTIKEGNTKTAEILDKALADSSDRIDKAMCTTGNIINNLVSENSKHTQQLYDYLISGKIQEHDKLLSQRLKQVDAKVVNNLTEIRKITRADRVTVIELHNNITNRGGLPFLEYDMTYETFNRGITPIRPSRTNRNTSILLPVFCDCETTDEVIYSKKELNELDTRKNGSDYLFYSLVTELNNETTIFHVLRNDNNTINGFVVLEFKNEENYKQHYIKNDIFGLIKEIETLLKLDTGNK